MATLDSWWDALVRDRFAAVLELVLIAIADDYADLAAILESINEWTPDPAIEALPARSAVPVSRAEVIKALAELIREGYAHAFASGGATNGSERADFREARAGELWFYVTPKGEQTANQLWERGQVKQ